jgi:hypothetical protein
MKIRVGCACKKISPIECSIFAAMSVIDLTQLETIEKPFVHVTHPQFVSAAVYAELRDTFPQCPPSTGPSGYSLYWEDDAYQRLLAQQPGWQALCDAFHSQAFIDWAVAQFAHVWERDGCRIDLRRARFVPYHEDRIDKERRSLRKIEHTPDELWVRMDIHQAQLGYARSIHRDHARRLISMLVYLCDHTASELTGGELLLHAAPWKRWAVRPTVVTPRENLMIAFPCSGRSHHSVPRVTQLTRPRNYLQVQISSSVDVWKH